MKHIYSWALVLCAVLLMFAGCVSRPTEVVVQTPAASVATVKPVTQLCVKVEASDGKVLPRKVQLDGVSLVADCADVTPTQPHNIHASILSGYQPIEDVVVAMEEGRTRTIEIVYLAIPIAVDHPVVDTFATICVKTLDGNGTPVSTVHTLDGVEFTTCKKVGNLDREHVLQPGSIAGWITPKSVVYAANELSNGETREEILSYASAQRYVRLSIADQFGNKVAGATFVFEGNRWVGDGNSGINFNTSKATNLVTFDPLAGYTTPAPLDLNTTSGDLASVVFLHSGSVANLCVWAKNDNGDDLPSAGIAVDGNRIPTYEHCLSVDVDTVHVVNGNYGGEFSIPSPVWIPAGILKPGEEITYKAFHDDDVTLCAYTVPVNGKVFVNDIFIGWASGDRKTCTTIRRSEVSRVTFGEVAGVQTAQPVDVDPSKFTDASPTAFGLYGADKNAFLHISAEMLPFATFTEGSALVDNAIVRWNYANRDVYMAVDPSMAHTITFRVPTDTITPLPVHIGVGELSVGQVRDVIGHFQKVPSPSAGATVRIRALTPFGNRMHFLALNQEDGRNIFNQDEYYTRIPAGDTLTLLFQPVGYLQPPPPLVLKADNLSVNDAEYQQDSNEWIFVVGYHTDGPAAKVCIKTFNGNGIPLPYTVSFDGIKSYDLYEEVDQCHVLPIGIDHILQTSFVEGHSYPPSRFFPAGVWQGGQNYNYQVDYVFEQRQTRVCISTNKVAELFLDGKSAGWINPDANACVVVAYTTRHTLSFGDIQGFQKPADIIYELGSLKWGETVNVLGTYH